MMDQRRWRKDGMVTRDSLVFVCGCNGRKTRMCWGFKRVAWWSLVGRGMFWVCMERKDWEVGVVVVRS